MDNYVAGFAFNTQETKVMLIQKTHPEWQKGKLNGVGGKIEDNELPIEAMVREFYEEAGISTAMEQWKRFCMLVDYRGYTVDYFCCHSILMGRMDYTIPNGLNSQQEKETIHIVKPQWVTQATAMVVPNLPWLVPMALASFRWTKITRVCVNEVGRMQELRG